MAAAHGGPSRALALYEWNATVAAAFHHDLGHLEIGLRNAYDHALSSRDRRGDRHWVFDPFRRFPVHEQRARKAARSTATSPSATTSGARSSQPSAARGATSPPAR